MDDKTIKKEFQVSPDIRDHYLETKSKFKQVEEYWREHEYFGRQRIYVKPDTCTTLYKRELRSACEWISECICDSSNIYKRNKSLCNKCELAGEEYQDIPRWYAISVLKLSVKMVWAVK